MEVNKGMKNWFQENFWYNKEEKTLQRAYSYEWAPDGKTKLQHETFAKPEGFEDHSRYIDIGIHGNDIQLQPGETRLDFALHHVKELITRDYGVPASEVKFLN